MEIKLNKNLLFIFTSLIIFISFISYISFIYFINNKDVLNHTMYLKVENTNIGLQVAQTSIEQNIGLGNIDRISKNEGMIFIFESDTITPFWMKNVWFPLDIIFIDSENRVIEIRHNVHTCINTHCELIKPSRSYRYVIELNGGVIKDLDLKIGDTLHLTHDK